jgi:GTPase SAR1 family protein
MYDVSNRESFKHATEKLYPKCKQELKEEQQFVMLIGNKMDVNENSR